METNPEPQKQPKRSGQDNPRSFLIVAAGLIVTFAAAYGFGVFLKTPPGARFSWELVDALIGFAATAPMLALLHWFSKTEQPSLARFRQSQIDFFSEIGFEFTPLRIAILAAGAGISEELLFRGVLQTWAAGFLPLALAIILPNILFGALHARTVLYAVIAGVVGVYLGVVFELTGNLLTPIVAHGFYDAVALEYTRRAVAKSRNQTT